MRTEGDSVQGDGSNESLQPIELAEASQEVIRSSEDSIDAQSEQRVRQIDAEVEKLNHAIDNVKRFLESQSSRQDTHRTEPSTNQEIILPEDLDLPTIENGLRHVKQEASRVHEQLKSSVDAFELTINALQDIDPSASNFCELIDALTQKASEHTHIIEELQKRIDMLTRQANALAAAYRKQYTEKQLAEAGYEPLNEEAHETITDRMNRVNRQRNSQFPRGIVGSIRRLLNRQEYSRLSRERSDVVAIAYRELPEELAFSYDYQKGSELQAAGNGLVLSTVKLTVEKALEHYTQLLDRLRHEELNVSGSSDSDERERALTEFIFLARQRMERDHAERACEKVMVEVVRGLEPYRFSWIGGQANLENLFTQALEVLTRSRQDTQRERNKQFLADFDMEAWQFQRHSLSSVGYVEKHLARLLAEGIVEGDESVDEIKLGEKLAYLPITETTPLLVLHAYDRRYASPLWPTDEKNRPDQSPIVRFIHRLSDQQIAELTTQYPPVADIIKQVKENPTTFWRHRIENPAVAQFREALLNDPEFYLDTYLKGVEQFVITEEPTTYSAESQTWTLNSEAIISYLPELEGTELPPTIPRGSELFSRLGKAIAARDVGDKQFIKGQFHRVVEWGTGPNTPPAMAMPEESYNYFLQKYGLTESDPGEMEPTILNPIYQQIERDTIKLSVLFAQRGEREQVFGIKYLQNRYLELDSTDRAALQETFTTASSDAQIEILKVLEGRAVEGTSVAKNEPSLEDIDALVTVCASYESLATPVREALVKMVPEIVAAYARTDRELNGLDKVAAILGISEAHCQATVNFMRGVRALDYNTFEYKFRELSRDDLNAFIVLGSIEGMLDFINRLSGYGYGFRIEDYQVLPKIIVDQEQIIYDLNLIHSIAPEFKYSLHWQTTREGANPLVAWVHYKPPIDVFMKLADKQSSEDPLPEEFLSRVIDQLDDVVVGRRSSEDEKTMQAVQAINTFLHQYLHEVFTPEGRLAPYRNFYGERNVVRLLLDNSHLYPATQIMVRQAYMSGSPLETYQDLFTDEDILRFSVRDPDQVENEMNLVTQVTASFGDERQKSLPLIKELLKAVESSGLNRELAVAFSQQCPQLLKYSSVRAFVLEHATMLLQNVGDLRFFNQVVGRYGGGAEPIIKGYQKCIAEGVITNAEQDLVLEFLESFRVVGPNIIRGYKEAKQNKQERLYLSELNVLASKMTGAGAVSETERNKPYFNELLQHVYQNNSGNWASIESNASCVDHNDHLEQFAVRPKYTIDLFSAATIRLKENQDIEPVKSIITNLDQSIMTYQEKASPDILTELNEQAEKALQAIEGSPVLEGIEVSSISKLEDRLLILVAEHLFGDDRVPEDTLKQLLIAYNFYNLGDPQAYFSDRNSRLDQANNREYAELCELHNFYQDQAKEGLRKIIEEGWQNEELVKLMPKYFANIQRRFLQEERDQVLARMQVDRLGLSEGFIKQVRRVLEKGKKQKYSYDHMRRIIYRYESFTQGLEEPKTQSSKSRTQAFYGQLRSQREKTRQLITEVQGTTLALSEFRLEEVDVNAVKTAEIDVNMAEQSFDEERFSAFLAERCSAIFQAEVNAIETATNSFESTSGSKREVVSAYVTKSKESAHARMVGGVCVSGDNPSKNAERNMWDMPNYFQLVLQDPENYRCQGLILLHHFTDEQGKKVLAASLNPSSTYLYSVDEAALFNGLLQCMEEFARDNNFDMILTSQNHQIRTNRTGGLFEKTLNERIEQVKESYTFSEPKPFSYSPQYSLQEMDVIWKGKQ